MRKCAKPEPLGLPEVLVSSHESMKQTKAALTEKRLALRRRYLELNRFHGKLFTHIDKGMLDESLCLNVHDRQREEQLELVTSVFRDGVLPQSPHHIRGSLQFGQFVRTCVY